jgi:hypothetical protein
MNFTYLQHPCISSFHGKIHLLLTTDFYTQVHEMSLVPRKKTSHGNVTFSRILCYILANWEHIMNMGYTTACPWHMLAAHSKFTDKVGTISWICWLSHDECSERAIEWDEILNLWWKLQSIPTCIQSNDCRGTLRRIGWLSFDLQEDHPGHWQNCIYTTLPYHLPQCILSISAQSFELVPTRMNSRRSSTLILSLLLPFLFDLICSSF